MSLGTTAAPTWWLSYPSAGARAVRGPYGELSADYKHVLDRLWKQNAGMTTRQERS